MKTRLVAILLLAIAVAGVSQSSADSAQTQQARAKISPWVLSQTAGGKQTEFFIVLEDQADLSGAYRLSTKEEKGRFVFDTLSAKAKETQQSLIQLLEARGVEYRPFYIVNAILVRGDLDLALALGSRADVARIDSSTPIHNQLEAVGREEFRTQAIEAGVGGVSAPEVWALGFTGQNVVIAGGDTGQRFDHAALRRHYRGFNRGAFTHDFNWHDSIHSGGGDCGADSTEPCDDSGHGTHTIGTAVGDDGAGNQIGVAPGAKWIGCRNMNRGVGTPATYLECFQFFLAPYPVGQSPLQGDPDKAPDITTNSWACPPSEGCSSDSLQAAVAAQRAAGIMTVVSAGNSGPGCSTVDDPPAIYDESYTVGAVDSFGGLIAGFSSRGPVTIDGSGRTKPDITAPGVGVRSSVRSGTEDFGALSGTSMAAPHVSGVAALLLSARPDLRGNVDEIEGYLNESALKADSTSCTTGTANNVFGNGRIDAKAAVDLALATLSSSAVAIPASGGAGAVKVIAAPGTSPNWSAANDDPNITIVAGGSGSGSATVRFEVSANSSPQPRILTLKVARRTLTIFQGGAGATCGYQVSAGATRFPGTAGLGSIAVATDAQCEWSASLKKVSWLKLTSTPAGLGTGLITFSLEQNSTGATRKTKIKVAGQTIVIKQTSL